MGVNLIVYEIKEGDKYPPRAKDWDSMRYGGDREFITADELPRDHMSIKHGWEIEVYWRPKDFDAHEKWIKENIGEWGQKRYLDMFERMKKDPNLWFYNSW